jgi:hypothetical protein
MTVEFLGRAAASRRSRPERTACHDLLSKAVVIGAGGSTGNVNFAGCSIRASPKNIAASPACPGHGFD